MKRIALLLTALLVLAACGSEQTSSAPPESAVPPVFGMEASPAPALPEASAPHETPSQASSAAESEAPAEPAEPTLAPAPPETPSPTPADDEARVIGTYYVNYDGVNLRAAPSTDSQILTQLPLGEPVSVLEDQGEWTQVYREGEVSYIASEYLSPEPPADEEGVPAYEDDSPVYLDSSWEFADRSAIHTGAAVLYRAPAGRKNLVVGVNAGHGTAGGESVYTDCHPDGSPKVTGGSTAAGSYQAAAVSSGMSFYDGTPERDVTLREAQLLRDLLLEAGYDVLMLRDGEDVQLDNVARTVICNNAADCHIAIHWDGDGLSYDKGCFYLSVPEELRDMYPVSAVWPEDDRLGDCLIAGLTQAGAAIHGGGSMALDLTQTSYSSVPSVDIELGNAASDHSDAALLQLAEGLLAGVEMFFG